MSNSDKISVIMSVYNSENTVSQAIESIIDQTYTNWEFIICDDASTDNTYDILLSYKNKYPEKIILLKNDVNYKLAYSLNKCLEYSSGTFIARMDADDISVNKRFEKQIKFLQKNPNVDLVGSYMQRFNEEGLYDIIKVELEPDKYSLKHGTPFNHATIMTYKYVYEQLEGYTVSKWTQRSQDYELWFRFFHKGFNGVNIEEPLYLVREDIDAIKRRSVKVRFNALKLTIDGYRLLDYPKSWYILPVIKTITKSLIPFHIQLMYRRIQGVLSKQ